MPTVIKTVLSAEQHKHLSDAIIYAAKNGIEDVIIDDTTKAVVQVSDNINPSTWIPDPSIINPYKPL